MTEKEVLITLAAFVPFGPARIKLLLEYFGSAKKVWRAPAEKFRKLGLSEKLVEGFDSHRKSFDFSSYFAKLVKFEVKVITSVEKNYPKRLKEIDDAPILIYVKGEIKPVDDLCIAIVGSRKVTSYGKEITARFSQELASAGVTIVSGLALGVDAVAHRAAIDGGGRTIAVLGSGVDVIYPSTNQGLAGDIARSGALISEYPLGYQALPINFPYRNRIISGMSLGVLVAEGAEKSGTLLTAAHAAHQGRDVFAVPGPITSPNSAAPNILLKQGAKLVTSAKDILEELDIGYRVQGIGAREILPQTKEEAAILELLDNEGLDIDSLVRMISELGSGMETGAILATLTNMELKGMVRNVGGVYIKF